MKKIVVVIRSSKSARVREALRAALGLSLRGDEVSVVMASSIDRDDPLIARSIATLEALGHHADASLLAVTSADVVEVWT